MGNLLLFVCFFFLLLLESFFLCLTGIIRRVSSTPTENWDSYLRDAAWPGMAAGVAALFISLVLLADAFIIGRMDHHQATRQVCGLALLVLCMATCLAFVFATAMAAQNIFSMKPHLNGYDSNNNNSNMELLVEDDDDDFEEEAVVVFMNCTPKTKLLWHLALGSAILGFLSCIFACWLIESQFLRSDPADEEDEEFGVEEATVGVILSGLGLESYKKVFESEEIDCCETLLDLNEEDLVKLGLPMGPRKKLLKWIIRKTNLPRQQPQQLFL